MSGKLPAVVLAAVLVVPLLVACDEDPYGHSLKEVKALPEASLLVPDSEVLETRGNEGGSAVGGAAYYVHVRTDLSAEAVFSFYRLELGARGWQFGRAVTQSGSLLEATGDKGDFGLTLTVTDPGAAQTREEWAGRANLYWIAIAAERGNGK